MKPPHKTQQKPTNTQTKINYVRTDIETATEVDSDDYFITEQDFKVYESAGFTQDEYWSYQWGLQNIGLDVVLNAIGQETQNVAVAVIDSGSPATTSTACE